MKVSVRPAGKVPKKYLPGHVVCSPLCRLKVAGTLPAGSSDTRRSKAEVYLEGLVRRDFPKEDLVCNDRTALYCGLELDLHLRARKIAVEVNGPTHYEPI